MFLRKRMSAFAAGVLLFGVCVASGCSYTLGPNFPESSSYSGDSVGVYVLPTRMCSDYFFADVLLDGIPMTLILDTGARGLHLDHTAVTRHRKATGKHRVGQLEFGDFTARGLSYDTVDFSRIRDAIGADVHGVIGYQIFRDSLLVIDYPAGELRLEAGQLDADDPRTVQYRLDHRGAPFLKFSLDDLEQYVLLDIGAHGGVSLSSLDGVVFLDEPRTLTRGTRVDRDFDKRVGRAVSTARFGPIKIDRPMISSGPPPSTIGQEVLQYFVVTFDQRRRLVRFDGPPTPIESEEMRGTGLGASAESAGYRVVEVYDGTPASRADIRSGDLVIAIDGIPVGDLGCEKRLARKEPSRESVRYTISRGDEVFDIEIAITALVE